MGTYINIGNAGFQCARNSGYVDKSGLIAVVNSSALSAVVPTYGYEAKTLSASFEDKCR